MSYFLAPGAARSAARALALSYPHIRLSEEPLFLRTAARAPGREVCLVAGGGSGHEPLDTGLLGPGGLDAVVPGEISAAPTARQIASASRAAASASASRAVLHIVKNYTGDRLAFAGAGELLRAEGYRVAQVVVDDDVATGASRVGRRGTAATVVVEKILGAAADRGTGLERLAALGSRVAAGSRTIGVAARAHTVPGTGRPAFDLPDGRYEYGIGIHGERGAATVSARSCAELVHRMVDDLLAETGSADGREVLLLVNGLGGTGELELRSIGELARARLAGRGVAVAALAAGTYVSALDTSGFSLTLTALAPGWLDLWCAPTRTPLRLPGASAPEAVADPVPPGAEAPALVRGSRVVVERLAEVCALLHPELTRLDTLSGDGDFGDNFTGGVARALERARADGTAGTTALAHEFLDGVGGTSGPLFGLLFQRVAPVLVNEEKCDLPAFTEAVAAARDAICRAGGAAVGDRTLVDALSPAVDTLAGAGADTVAAPLTEAALAAVDGARRTAGLRGRLGRSSYVGAHSDGVLDPGAVAVAVVFTTLAAVYEPAHAHRLPSPGGIVDPVRPRVP
ncbi:dihydroxyacetone kinase subunit DhaK [Streptomyces sp. NPDC001985]|uniref:dihydroxyacetone kinase subunit DhaK n=1 Tax=Streptomyces sp. NPDC001985 TaxID=3154406 RepID=UPI003332C727